MSIKYAIWHLRGRLVVPTTAAFLIGLGTLAGVALPKYSISQKGREYRPGEISIKHGETLQIVNDDGDLLITPTSIPPISHSTPKTSSRAARPTSHFRWPEISTYYAPFIRR